MRVAAVTGTFPAAAGFPTTAALSAVNAGKCAATNKCQWSVACLRLYFALTSSCCCSYRRSFGCDCGARSKCVLINNTLCETGPNCASHSSEWRTPIRMRVGMRVCVPVSVVKRTNIWRVDCRLLRRLYIDAHSKCQALCIKGCARLTSAVFVAATLCACVHVRVYLCAHKKL